jgi:hypothetical protein
LKRILKDLHEEVSDLTVIYCDNLSNIQLAKNPVFHARTKHIEVHYHPAATTRKLRRAE